MFTHALTHTHTTHALTHTHTWPCAGGAADGTHEQQEKSASSQVHRCLY